MGKQQNHNKGSNGQGLSKARSKENGKRCAGHKNPNLIEFQKIIEKLSQQELPQCILFLGTTTLRRMINAVYDENDPLHASNYYSECMGAHSDLEDNPSRGDEIVYVYYHEKCNETVMTNIKGDFFGFYGSSAGFTGRVEKKHLNASESLGQMSRTTSEQ